MNKSPYKDMNEGGMTKKKKPMSYNKGGMAKQKPMSYNKGGMVKANCGASRMPMKGKK